MTTTFDLGCQRMLYSFPPERTSSASFLPAPDLTDLGCVPQAQVFGMRSSEGVLVPDWQLTGAGHGMSFVAWRYVELF